MFSPLLHTLLAREDLTTDEAAAAMAEIMAGRAEPTAVAGLLVALAMKGERPHEIVGFAGLMGAGRTEVARAVFGADPLDAGCVELQGRALRIRSPRDAIRSGIAYLSEDRKAFGLAVEMAQRLTGGAVVDPILLPPHLVPRQSTLGPGGRFMP